MDTLVAEHEKLVYERPQALTDVNTHYCPGCTHGTAHRIIAEVIDHIHQQRHLRYDWRSDGSD